VLVRIGLEANTGYLRGCLSLDERGQVVVDDNLETSVPGVFAAGDIRHNSPMQVSTAVGDGAAAGLSACRLLGTR
jgi:thioredoxin reductase (NADPH)